MAWCDKSDYALDARLKGRKNWALVWKIQYDIGDFTHPTSLANNVWMILDAHVYFTILEVIPATPARLFFQSATNFTYV